MFAITIGVLSACVILIVQWRINLKKFLGYPAALDLGVTLALMWMLHGSYAGMTAALVGGLFYSLMITILRKLYGYAYLKREGWKLVWYYHKPDVMCELKARNWTMPSTKTICYIGLAAVCVMAVL